MIPTDLSKVLKRKADISATGDATNFPAGTKNTFRKISGAGILGGGLTVAVGDILVCHTSAAAGTYAAVGANWTHIASGSVSATATRTANTVLAGPASGAAAAPTFRAMVHADLPELLDFALTGDGMNFPAASKGEMYLVSGSSCYVGGNSRADGYYLNAGDILLCIADTTAGTYAQKGGNWWIKPRVISMEDGDRLVLMASNTAVTPIAGENGFGPINNIWWKLENGVLSPFSGPKEISIASSGALSDEYCYGGLINNYGMTDADCTITLPAPTLGMNFTVILGAARAKYWRLDPDANSSIYLDGVTTGDGKYVGLAAAAVGKAIQFVAFRTGASAYDWFATIINGSWVAEA